MYPPAINFATYLSDNFQSNDLTDITLVTTKPNTELHQVSLPNVQIIRYQGIAEGMSAFKKLRQYLYVYTAVTFKLFKYKPQSLFYYETLSSLPFVIYSVFYKKINLYIHYHELFTHEQLQKGRPLHKFLNLLENRFLYARAKWISETNSQRMTIFLEQYGLAFDFIKHRILPNYPPKKWIEHPMRNQVEDENTNKIKLLHIGSLSFETMFLNEILEHFGNNDRFEITFYSHITDNDSIEKLKSYRNVIFKGSINYREIPNLKGMYDVGLVIYKGNSLNVIYSAPNKIFEYLALGLDVWCSDKLITAQEFQTQETYPKLVMVDFENISRFNIQKALNREKLLLNKSPYYSETVYKPLVECMCDDFKLNITQLL